METNKGHSTAFNNKRTGPYEIVKYEWRISTEEKHNGLIYAKTRDGKTNYGRYYSTTTTEPHNRD